MEGPHLAHPVLPDDGRVSSLPLTLSLPIATLTTWALNFPFYFIDAAAANAWRARAVDYSIGVGCAGTAASLFLCAEKRWSAGTLRGWKMAAARTGQSGKVELVYLLAYTVALFSGVSSLGFAIRTFKEGDSGDGLLALVQALWEVVPVVLLVMLAIRKLLPLIGDPSSTV